MSGGFWLGGGKLGDGGWVGVILEGSRYAVYEFGGKGTRVLYHQARMGRAREHCWAFREEISWIGSDCRMCESG